jgi:transcriptional regulator with XRE-family HTH domain
MSRGRTMPARRKSTFGERLRELRQGERLSAKALGEQISYSASHILNVEAGRERGSREFLEANRAYFKDDAADLAKCYAEQIDSHAQTGLRSKHRDRKLRLNADLAPLVGEWHVIWQGTSPDKPLCCCETVDLQGDGGADFHMVKKVGPAREPSREMHPEPWKATCVIDESHRVKGSYECADRTQLRVDGQFYVEVLPGAQLMWGTWTGLTEEHLHAVGLVVFARDLTEGLEKISAIREQFGFLPFIFRSPPEPADPPRES